jgi:hypothetical protein
MSVIPSFAGSQDRWIVGSFSVGIGVGVEGVESEMDMGPAMPYHAIYVFPSPFPGNLLGAPARWSPRLNATLV